jgi:hypothetical protein
MKRKVVAGVLLCLSVPCFAQEKPNILVIFGDDVGIMNISASNKMAILLTGDSARYSASFSLDEACAGRARITMAQLYNYCRTRLR